MGEDQVPLVILSLGDVICINKFFVGKENLFSDDSKTVRSVLWVESLLIF